MIENDKPGIGGTEFKLVFERLYFTPEIEDVHVGYECQHTTNMSAFKINDTDRIYTNPITEHELSDYVRWSVEEGGLEKFIRTPFLSKGDLIREGWTFYATEYIGEITLENMSYCFINEEKNYLLQWYFNTNQIVLIVRDPSLVQDYYTAPTYRGGCTDINEFRKIIKLLRI